VASGRRGSALADHAIGRSRGGLTTKTHALVDGGGLPLVTALIPGQAGNSTALRQLLAVERALNHLKNWCGLATRYDKHALIYRGGIVLASILLWPS